MYINNHTAIVTPPSHGYIILLLYPSYRPIIIKIFMRLRRASVF